MKIAKGVVAIEPGPNELHVGSSVGDANLSAVFHNGQSTFQQAAMSISVKSRLHVRREKALVDCG